MAPLSDVSQNKDTASSRKHSRCRDPLFQRKTCQTVVPGAAGETRHVKCFPFPATKLLVNNGILRAERWDQFVNGLRVLAQILPELSNDLDKVCGPAFDDMYGLAMC